MKTYFEDPLQVSAIVGSPTLCRLSIRSSENRVDEYVFSTSLVEHIIKNATSTTWETLGEVSVRLVDGSNVYLRVLTQASQSNVYLVPLSAVQMMSGQYLDVTRKE